MRVTKDNDLPVFRRYTDPSPCNCSFDLLATGKTNCTPCSAAAAVRHWPVQSRILRVAGHEREGEEMHGQVTRAILTGLLGGLLLAGCGSGSKANVDAPPPPPPPPDAGEPSQLDAAKLCNQTLVRSRTATTQTRLRRRRHGHRLVYQELASQRRGGELVKRVPPPVCIP